MSKIKPLFPVVQYRQLEALGETEFKTILRYDDGRDIYEIHQTDVLHNRIAEIDLELAKGTLKERYKQLMVHFAPAEFHPPADDQASDPSRFEDLDNIQLIQYN